MRKAQQLHTSAMRAADEALGAQRNGNNELAGSLFKTAMEIESAAAELTSEQPSRAILFRSAANLALDCGDFGEAERLACLGLISRPPDDIADELRHTLDRATFSRHLRLEGISLGPSAVQLTVAGPSVGYGDAPEPEVMSRVDAYRKLVMRAANRIRGIAYSDAPSQRGEEPDYQLFMSTPRAASFAVTLRVGARQMQNHFEFDVTAEAVVDDLLTNLRHFEESREEPLREAIPDGDYRRNFVALARRLAPDGTRITTVGLTRERTDGSESVALREPRSSHQIRRSKSAEAPITTLEGQLNFADSRSKRKAGRIILTTQAGEYPIAVPRGVLADIVRPYFDQFVTLRVRKRSSRTFEFVDFVER